MANKTGAIINKACHQVDELRFAIHPGFDAAMRYLFADMGDDGQQ
ncbi:hypothetical protein [Sulfuriferula sp. AH1]|nr:hypothetical protein [Sulfuriferula sp. AH1]